MATYNCHPPFRHHATRQIASSKALSLLSQYLAAAGSDASFHPNALLTEAGPVTPSPGTHQMGLVLHNVQRVEAGLKGEQLTTELAWDEHAEGEPSGTELASQDLFRGANHSLATNHDGWQDKAEFDREQDIDQGEMGDRDNLVGYQGDGVRIPNVWVEGTKSATEKDARKRKKKERRLQDRRAVLAKQKLESHPKE